MTSLPHCTIKTKLIIRVLWCLVKPEHEAHHKTRIISVVLKLKLKFCFEILTKRSIVYFKRSLRILSFTIHGIRTNIAPQHKPQSVWIFYIIDKQSVCDRYKQCVPPNRWYLRVYALHGSIFHKTTSWRFSASFFTVCVLSLSEFLFGSINCSESLGMERYQHPVVEHGR